MLTGVTQEGSFCPSIWICAPAGVELTFSCPGTIAGATGLGLVFFLLLYFGCTETAGGATVTGSGATCTAVWLFAFASADRFALPFGCAGTLAAGAGGWFGASSSAFSEWMCHAIAATISTMMPMAPATENMKSCGGVFLISATAFFATSRGWIFGFSGAALLNTVACTASGAGGSSAGRGGGGGATYTSLRGGSSSISEKLRLAPAPAFGPSAIIGSTLIFGASTSGSTIAADDMVAGALENDSTEKVSTEASGEVLITGAAWSRFRVMSPLELAEFPPLPLRPAAAAFAAGGGVGVFATGAAGLEAGFGCVTAGGTLAADVGFCGAGAFCAACPGLAAAAALLALSLHRSRSFTRSCPV